LSSAPRRTEDLELRFRILSAEYSHLTSMLTSTWSTSAARTNLFFVAVSAAGVALALLSNGQITRTFLILTLSILLLILVMGLVALSRMLHANRESIRQLQSIIRIRRFFVQLDPGSAAYITLPTHDDRMGLFGMHDARSSFGAMTQLPAASMATLVALVDAFVTAALVGTVWMLVFSGDPINAVIAAGISLALATVAYQGWVYRDLMQIRRSLEVRFPTPKGR